MDWALAYWRRMVYAGFWFRVHRYQKFAWTRAKSVVFLVAAQPLNKISRVFKEIHHIILILSWLLILSAALLDYALSFDIPAVGDLRSPFDGIGGMKRLWGSLEV